MTWPVAKMAGEPTSSEVITETQVHHQSTNSKKFIWPYSQTVTKLFVTTSKPNQCHLLRTQIFIQRLYGKQNMFLKNSEMFSSDS